MVVVVVEVLRTELLSWVQEVGLLSVCAGWEGSNEELFLVGTFSSLGMKVRMLFSEPFLSYCWYGNRQSVME